MRAGAEGCSPAQFLNKRRDLFPLCLRIPLGLLRQLLQSLDSILSSRALFLLAVRDERVVDQAVPAGGGIEVAPRAGGNQRLVHGPPGEGVGGHRLGVLGGVLRLALDKSEATVAVRASVPERGEAVERTVPLDHLVIRDIRRGVRREWQMAWGGSFPGIGVGVGIRHGQGRASGDGGRVGGGWSVALCSQRCSAELQPGGGQWNSAVDSQTARRR